MAVCSDCASSVPPSAGWCGACGALVVATSRRRAEVQNAAGSVPPWRLREDARRRPVEPASSTFRGDRTRSSAARLGTGAVLVATAVVLLSSLSTPDRATPDAARAGASTTTSTGTDGVTGATGMRRWHVDGGVSAVATGPVVVRPAGSGHVAVGRDVVTTSGGHAVHGRRLPSGLADTAIDPEGRWAVAEAGELVVGRVDRDAVRRSRVAGSWRPHGAGVTWADGGVLMHGTEGRLGLVALDGTVVWTTREPLDPSGSSDRLLTGRTTAGTEVVLDLVTGRSSPLPPVARVVAVGTDTLLTVGPGDRVRVVGRDGQPRSGSQVVAGAGTGRWDTTSAGFVLTTPTTATLVDPDTGAAVASVTGRSPVAVADGVVVLDDGALTLRTWDGRVGWTRRLVDRPARPRRIDDGRISVAGRAVGATTDEQAVVAVLDTATGTTLAAAAPTPLVPRRWRSIVGAVDQLVAITGGGMAGTAGVAWVDARTGRPDPRAAAALLGGDGNGWRFVGWLGEDGPGPPAPVRARQQGGSVVVRVGADDPIEVDVAPKGLGVGNPVLGVGTMAFSMMTPGRGAVLVDADSGVTASVDGLTPLLVVDTTPVVVAGADPSSDPFGRQPVDLAALDPRSGVERWRTTALTTIGVFGDGPEVVDVRATRVGPVLVEAGSTVVRGTAVADGRTLWTERPDAVLAAVPVVAGDLVAVPLVDGTVLALDAASGRLRWSARTGLVTAAAGHAHGLLLGTMGGGVLALDLTGRLTGSVRVADEPVHDVAQVGEVLVAAAGGRLVGVSSPSDGGSIGDRVRR